MIKEHMISGYDCPLATYYNHRHERCVTYTHTRKRTLTRIMLLAYYIDNGHDDMYLKPPQVSKFSEFVINGHLCINNYGSQNASMPLVGSTKWTGPSANMCQVLILLVEDYRHEDVNLDIMLIEVITTCRYCCRGLSISSLAVLKRNFHVGWKSVSTLD